MCFDSDAVPPLPPRTDALEAVVLDVLDASDGNQLAAVTASTRLGDAPGLVLLPDNRGLTTFHANLAPLTASAGVHAVSIDLYGRTAGAAYRDSAFDAKPHRAAARDELAAVDVSAGVDRLRAIGAQDIYVMGFCFGGRIALLQGVRDDVAGVIGLYPWPARVEAGGTSPVIEAYAGRIRAPTLAIYGGEDHKITRDHRDEFAAALESRGVPHDSVCYPGLPHGFFDRRKCDAGEASADVWRRVLDFVGGSQTVTGRPVVV